jgi:hypothetical protein|tara:strand:- start:3879 stop:4463 length:585 start_codon:yes stop_codon:yes gene_type:complete
MQLSDKDQAIIVQVAGKAAVEIVQSDAAIAAVRNGTYYEMLETVYSCLLEAMNPATAAPVVQLTSAASTQQAAVEAVLSEIPGATVTADVGADTYVPGAPTAIHEKSSMVEMLEDALIHNPHNWKIWDTEKATMNGGNSPDISHETLMQAGSTFKVGVFMVSRYAGQSAPEWAWQKLGKLPQYSQLVAAGKITF